MHLAKYFIRTWYKNVCFSKQACLGAHQVVQHEFILLELVSLGWTQCLPLCLSAWCVHSPQQFVEAPSSEPRMAQTGLRLQQHRFPGEARVGQYALPSVVGGADHGQRPDHYGLPTAPTAAPAGPVGVSALLTWPLSPWRLCVIALVLLIHASAFVGEHLIPEILGMRTMKIFSWN